MSGRLFTETEVEAAIEAVIRGERETWARRMKVEVLRVIDMAIPAPAPNPEETK